jgi:hypothetical protein
MEPIEMGSLDMLLAILGMLYRMLVVVFDSQAMFW